MPTKLRREGNVEPWLPLKHQFAYRSLKLDGNVTINRGLSRRTLLVLVSGFFALTIRSLPIHESLESSDLPGESVNRNLRRLAILFDPNHCTVHRRISLKD